jgi:hypothetical protein
LIKDRQKALQEKRQKELDAKKHPEIEKLEEIKEADSEDEVSDESSELVISSFESSIDGTRRGEDAL